MNKKIKEWLSIQFVKYPARMVLLVILIFNILFFFFSAGVISALSLQGTEQMSFIEAAFCTITMILDAGCIQFVISDIGKSGFVITIICLMIILIGMISFTGAVIGYVTNYISQFIENANTGKKKLYISEHTVILNWNTRASEIINDLMYSDEKQKVVVLVSTNKEEIEKEIEERIADTVIRENKAIYEANKDFSLLVRLILCYKNRFRPNITIIVREGDVFSSKQLHDISVEYAKAVIILGNDVNSSVCKFDYLDKIKNNENGNSQTIKTLMQVADITADLTSADNQKIIVEITDDWTGELVDKIIACKQVDGKCNIVPVKINAILGQLLSQFSIMPELNMVYRELFSNKGAAIYSEPVNAVDDATFCQSYLTTHKHAIPLMVMDSSEGVHGYYMATSEKYVKKISNVVPSEYKISLKENYWLEKRTIVILGHNSNSKDIMKGFESFVSEWGKDERDILAITVIDNYDNLEKMNFYNEYPFVVNKVAADFYNKDLTCSTIRSLIDANEEISVLILSDDSALNSEIDAGALANLIYVQDIVNAKVAEDPQFKPSNVDVVVEIIDPKHHDIVNSYNVNNVVISNRYISKMITQISEKEAIYDFYKDILTYDVGGEYESMEIYIKKVSRYFDVLPEKCTVQELVRALLDASIESSKDGEKNIALILGYVNGEGEMFMFTDDQSDMEVQLTEQDKLVIFSNH